MAISRFDIDAPVDRLMYIEGRGHMLGFPGRPGESSNADGSPINGKKGWSPGARWFNYKALLAGGLQAYVNIGTYLSSLWVVEGVAAGNVLVGVAAGYKLARGVTALDGTNPTPVVTGLSTVVAATVSLEGTAAPGVGTSILTVSSANYATGALAVYGWKVTGAGDTTLIASTGTENFEWIAVGT